MNLSAFHALIALAGFAFFWSAVPTTLHAQNTESTANSQPAPVVPYTQPGHPIAGSAPAEPPVPPAENEPSAAYSPASQPDAGSSSSYRPEGQPATAMGQPVLAPRYTAQPSGYVQRSPVSLFSTVAVQIKVGAGGPGLDLAVPLANRLNLRAGGSYFSYAHTFNVNGMDIDGKLLFRAAHVSLDIFPFGNGFRVSPGVTVYNRNHLRATMLVPAGQTFTLNDVDYTSSPTDPVHGDGGATFGEQAAPRFTLGWGNMIPRDGRHWSVPFELGFEYIQQPRVTMNLYGTACSFQDGENGCAPLQTDPTAQANLAAEIKKINNDIEPLRFYPILSVGFAWSFNLHPQNR